MSFAFAQQNSFAAAMRDGSCGARTSFFALIFAGIALAVSVIFFSLAVLDVRLQAILVIILVLALILVMNPYPRRRKR